jgi:transposase
MTTTSADMASSSSGPVLPARRTCTNECKLGIVAEYDGADQRGQRGALLRREGLYDSHIGKWRAARDAGRLSGTGTPPPAKAAATAERENARLRAQAQRLSAELDSTKAVLDIMGRVSGLLRAISVTQEPPRPSSRSCTRHTPPPASAASCWGYPAPVCTGPGGALVRPGSQARRRDPAKAALTPAEATLAELNRDRFADKASEQV